MLLDQQVPMEWAFIGPATLRRAPRATSTPATIAAMDVEEFVAVCAEKPGDPPLPRRRWARRIHELCQALVDDYGGDGRERLDVASTTATSCTAGCAALPGYGDEKSRIFVAILGQAHGRARRRVARGGRASSATTCRGRSPTSTTPASLAEVREWKKAQKAAKQDKQDRPA